MREMSVKHVLEGDNTVSVIDALWSGAEWSSRWEGIKGFHKSYDDGAHQVSKVSLEWYGSNVVMDLVRFRTEVTCIEFFCPQPPFPLAHQSGFWKVERCQQMNFLVAFRRIALEQGPEESEAELELRLDDYVTRLSKRLSIILPRFTCISGALG